MTLTKHQNRIRFSIGRFVQKDVYDVIIASISIVSENAYNQLVYTVPGLHIELIFAQIICFIWYSNYQSITSQASPTNDL